MSGQGSWVPGGARCPCGQQWLSIFCSKRTTGSGFFLFIQGLPQMSKIFPPSPCIALGPLALFFFSFFFAESLDHWHNSLYWLFLFLYRRLRHQQAPGGYVPPSPCCIPSM